MGHQAKSVVQSGLRGLAPVAARSSMRSYALSDRGRALIPALEQISLWAGEHLVQDET